MTTSICKFCLESKFLIRSHIIPASLYPETPGHGRLHWVLNGDGETPKSSLSNGDFDGKLVCADCEKKFGTGDAYAKRFFVDRSVPADLLTDANGSKMHVYPSFDYDRLKLFFISLLWRAHATDRRSFRDVDIGARYEELAKATIRSGDGGGSDDFAVFLWHIAPGPYREIGMSLMPNRIEGVSVYQTLLFGHAAFIKVDEKPLPPLLRSMQLTRGQPLVVLEYRMEETPFFSMALDASRKAQDIAESNRARKKQK